MRLPRTTAVPHHCMVLPFAPPWADPLGRTGEEPMQHRVARMRLQECLIGSCRLFLSRCGVKNGTSRHKQSSSKVSDDFRTVTTHPAHAPCSYRSVDRRAAAPRCRTGRRVRRAGENRMFELAQPRTRGKSQRGEAVLCHVDVRFLLDGIGETGYVVVDEAPANTKSRLVVQNILHRCERGA